MKPLIEASLIGESNSFEIDLDITVNSEVWQAYEAQIAYRDILFFCKQGTATYFVDSYGTRNTFELFDWEKE